MDMAASNEWRYALQVFPSGRAKATIINMVLLLRHAPEWYDHLSISNASYDTATRKVIAPQRLYKGVPITKPIAREAAEWLLEHAGMHCQGASNVVNVESVLRYLCTERHNELISQGERTC